MKKIFYFDKTGIYSGTDYTDSDLPANATLVDPYDTTAPINDPITWDGSKWNYADTAKASQLSYAPTPEQQSLTELGQQMADQQQQIASLEKALTALAKGGAKS